MWTKNKIIILLIGLLVICVLISDFLNRQYVPMTDSGVFLYIGDQILHGKIPYKDIWDHKPPLIFFINASALILGKGSVWGIYLFEFLSIFTAGATGYLLLKRVFGLLPSIVGTFFWLVSLVVVIYGGNYPEEFVLPIEFFSLYIFWKSETSGYSKKRLIMLGLAFALTLLLKPNLISLYISIIIYFILKALFKKDWKKQVKNIIIMSTTTICVISIVSLYYFINNAYNEFFDRVIIYNSIYVTKSIVEEAGSILLGFYKIPAITTLALISWLVILCKILRTRFKDINPLVRLSFICFPIMIFLVNVSGKGYVYYYIGYLPIFSVLIANLITTLFPKRKQLPAARTKYLFLMAILPIIIPMLFLQIIITVLEVVGSPEGQLTRRETIKYIDNSTSQDDYVLMWGSETATNFVTKRKSPVKYPYQSAIFTKYYQNRILVNDFLSDLNKNKPAIIIDASANDKNIPPLNSNKRKTWKPNDNRYGLSLDTDEIFKYIDKHYKQIKIIGENYKWVVYKRI